MNWVLRRKRRSSRQRVWILNGGKREIERNTLSFLYISCAVPLLLILFFCRHGHALYLEVLRLSNDDADPGQKIPETTKVSHLIEALSKNILKPASN